MKYIAQFCIILGYTFIGEALQRFLPLPIPGSVYSLILLFLALCFGIVRLDEVQETAHYLSSILPVMFVAPAVGIVEYWDLISSSLFPILLVILGTTVITFGISGTLAQRLMNKKKEDDNHE